MTVAEALRAISHHTSPVKFHNRRDSVVAKDVVTGVIVAQVRVAKGASHDALTRSMVDWLLENDMCDIVAVDGEDTDTPLTLPEEVPA